MNGSRRSIDARQVGIVHLGLGAFFRAHGAVYLQEAMAASGGDWGVVGVSLRSPQVRDALVPQDCVYTAVETSADGLKPQAIEVLRDVLVAPEGPEAVLETMAQPDVRIVSLTVTEKGYGRGADGGLDAENADIAHDLTHPLPCTPVGYLVRALALRRAQALPPFTVMSLDNLPGNGVVTRRLVLDFANRVDPALADWIAAEGRFPSSMVDRIVPATTDALVARLEDETDVHDPAAVFHEPFRQWVIEDDFVDGARPDFGAVGAQMVRDVAPFEHMKLRMLNGTHSALAYVGSLAGHETVADAIADPSIAEFIRGLWEAELAPSFEAPEGVDLVGYAQALEARYRNPEIRHLLKQIAMDGSQKLPQRILDALFANRSAGRPYGRLLTVVAAWVRFVAQGEAVNDPLAGEIATVVEDARDDRALVAGLLALSPVFGPYPAAEIAEELCTCLEDGTLASLTGELR